MRRSDHLPQDIIVGVPGAFSPQCSDQVPGYLDDADKFAAKGVKGIYVVAVNDVFTIKGWKEKLGAEKAPLVRFVADDEAKVSPRPQRDLITSFC